MIERGCKLADIILLSASDCFHCPFPDCILPTDQKQIHTYIKNGSFLAAARSVFNHVPPVVLAKLLGVTSRTIKRGG